MTTTEIDQTVDNDENFWKLYHPLREFIQAKVDTLPSRVTNGMEHVSLNQHGLHMFILENADAIRKILNSVEDKSE